MLLKKIGENELRKANETLLEYKEGKANLEKRLVDNEQWWKMRHTEANFGSETDMKQASGWLFNCIISKHADAIEAYPTFNCLPREEGDKIEAEKITSILPVILKQNKFEQTYSDEAWDKIKSGIGIYGVFWDSTKLNGLGDISIELIEPLNLFWQPGINNIQESRNIFYVKLVDNDILEARYPELEGKLSTDKVNISKYIYDDTVDTTNQSLLVDWYYMTTVNGKKVLQYCKYVNETVLYASEDDPNRAEIGWYKHGRYPFVVDKLFPVKGSIAGFGYVDVCRQPQKYIDILNQTVIKNAVMGATPRFFIRSDGAVNEEEYADWTKTFVHANGNLGEDSIRPIDNKPLNDIYVTVMNNKIEELKETSGNRDVNNGGSASGVTAASAIAAMQEQSGKTSRDSTKAAYRCYEDVIILCIELIREFYDTPRQFRITGQYGIEQFVSYSNAGIVPQHQGIDFGQDMGYRTPVFDLEISAQKESAYTKIAQNELALQFYNAGFFNPELATQALAVLDMMDFNHKDTVMQKIAQNGGLYQENIKLKQQLLQMAEIVDSVKGTNMAETIAQSITGMTAVNNRAGTDIKEASNIEGLKSENTIVENAKNRAAQASQPS